MAPMYEAWLEHVFERPKTASGWYFDLNIEPFDAKSTQLTILLTNTFINSGVDLDIFSKRQINEGLNYIFNTSCSDISYVLKDISVPVDDRTRAIKAIRNLYSDCFAVKCTESLSHLSESSTSEINQICYMLWDVSPYCHWDNSSENSIFHTTIFEVLEAALHMTHQACVESAIHGLGHMHAYEPDSVELILSQWLSKRAASSSPLVKYAKAACQGNVQ